MVSDNNWINYELPAGWRTEKDGENILMYYTYGEGTMAVSFYNLSEHGKSPEAGAGWLADQFLKVNMIELHSPLVVNSDKDGRTVLSGSGTARDGWYVKLWIVAEKTKLIFSTYQSEKENSEVEKCDEIIDSISFIF